MYFASPTSNITPAQVSVAMSRSDSRDSTYASYEFTSQPMTVSYSTSPLHSHAMRRTYSSSTSSSVKTAGSMQRRDSSSQWIASPYRSCLQNASQDEPSSYLSEDDLLHLECGANYQALPIESIPNPTLRKKEMTTEEQIAMYRDLQERERQFEQRRSSGHQVQPHSHQKTVRFANEQRKSRRPSAPRRPTPVRRYNGPM